MLQLANSYKLLLPNGDYRIVGPDSNEDNFVAHITNITSDVRWETTESQITQADGSYIGPSYRGTRTVVIDMAIYSHDPLYRADCIEWLQSINGFLQEGSGLTLQWQEATGWDKQIEDLRPSNYITPVSDGAIKNLQLALRTGNPFIHSQDIHYREVDDQDGSMYLYNGGNAPAFPKFYIYGPFSAFTLENEVTNEELTYTGSVADGSFIEVDTTPTKRTVLLNGTTNAYGNLDFSSSSFFSVPPMTGSLEVSINTTGGGANTKTEARWRSAWE